MNDTTNQQNTERLRQLRQSADEWNRTTGRRWLFSAAGMVVMVLFTGAYLYWAQAKVAEVTPRDVVAIAEQQLRPVLEMPEAQLAQQFREAAPSVIAKAEQALRSLPEMAEMQAEAQIMRGVEEALPRLEQELSVAFDTALYAARDRVIEQGGSVDDPQQVKAMMAQIAIHLRREMQAAVDMFYRDYVAKSSELVDYLEDLGQNRGLDERGKLHRQMLVAFFKLMQKYQLQGTPPTFPEMPLIVDAAPTAE